MSNADINPLAGGAVVENDPAQRNQAMIAHLLGIITLLGPGIFYLIKKNDPTFGPFAKQQNKEVINWGIGVVVVSIVLYIAMFIALFISGMLAMVVSLLMLAVWLGNIILVVLNAMKANKGIAAQYPFTLKILK